jgi:hypothetical protein
MKKGKNSKNFIYNQDEAKQYVAERYLKAAQLENAAVFIPTNV